ncbi:MAG: hypothetical protein R3A49_07890 [Acidimicrobiia bacterium]
MTIDDFPGGWRQEQIETSEFPGAFTPMPDVSSCTGLSGDDAPETSAEAASTLYTRLDSAAANQVAVFASDEPAADFVDSFDSDETAECLTGLLEEFVGNQFAVPEDFLGEDFESLFPEGEMGEIPEVDPEELFPSPEEVEATAGQLSIESFGDETVAFEAVASFGDFLGFGFDSGVDLSTSLDLVVVRVGPAVTIIQVLSSMGPPDLTAALAETSSEHLDEAVS